MANRGDGEPEYIDDDEFYDPAEFSGSGRQSANVLGSSGSRQTKDSRFESAEGKARDKRDPRPKSGQGAGKESKTGRKPVKARNPAPSMSNSEERRARLAGKHQKTASHSESHKPEKSREPEQNAGKGRFGGLRARLSRGDKSPRSTAKPASNVESPDTAAASGIKGRIGAFRGRLRRRDTEDASAGGPSSKTDRKTGKSSQTYSGSAFGASRGAKRPADAKRGDARSMRQEAKPTDVPRAKASKAPKIESGDWLDLDRKLDIIGVGLVFGATVFVFSALSAEQAAIGGVHTIVGQSLGWGAIAVPVTMFAIGLWLIVRHFGDEPPTIDPIRLTGAALALLGALVLFQFIDSLGYPNQCGRDCIGQVVRQSYLDGRGGGLIGGWLYSALVINLTELGGFALVFMVLTIAAMLTTRSTMVELAVVAISVSRNVRKLIGQVAVQRRAARLKAQQEQPALPQEDSHVRISKPEPAQLTAAPINARTLPEPRSDWMPIPNRLRAFLAQRRRSELEQEAQQVSLETPAQARDQSMVKRVLSRMREEKQPAPDVKRNELGPSGRLERFLNLGDDLPPATTGQPSAERSAPQPRPNRANPPPVASSIQPHAPAKPAVARPISPPEPAQLPESPPTQMRNIATFQPEQRDEVAEKEDAAPLRGDEPEALDKALEQEDAATESEAIKTEVKPSAIQREAAFEPPAVPASEKPRPRIDWNMPDYQAVLNRGTASELDQEPLLQQAKIIEDTLASFGAPGRVVEINSGPVITQYGVEPAYLTAKTGKRNRVKVGAIAKLDKDLQLALGARSLRMEAPVPGKGYVGIEVPNPTSARVGLRDVMDSSSYQKIDSPLAIALGMSVDGKPIAADLTQMPHLLVAGTTGSGKSVCVNAIINSILVNNSPETVRFIMVDPKRVELTGYNGLPHLVAPVVVELERIIGVLRWVTTEMDERYKKFSRAGARNIIDYNSLLDPDLAAMPYIVVIIDELADLMMMAPDDTERAIARIAALARATGIHLVIATQRPSVDVVTGLIKANCPARIAFAVASSVDSRVIIDQPGAERLLGKGDMLYLSGDTPAPQRVQGVHVSNEEIKRIGRFWKLQKSGIAGVEPIPLPPKSSSAGPMASKAPASESSQKGSGSGQAAFWDMAPSGSKANKGKTGNLNPDEDELYQTAVDMVRRLEKASISLLQRRLRIGYTRAARLVDMMEERGVVGPPKEGSSKPRDVLPL